VQKPDKKGELRTLQVNNRNTIFVVNEILMKGKWTESVTNKFVMCTEQILHRFTEIDIWSINYSTSTGTVIRHFNNINRG